MDGSGLYDLSSYRLSAILEARSAWSSNLLSSNLSLAWNSQAQFRSNVDPDPLHVTVPQRDAWEIQDARYRYERLTGTFKVTSSPLQDLWLLAPTSLSYTLVGYLYNTSYREDSSARIPGLRRDGAGVDHRMR